ncbi:hypothetical protein LCX93_05275 [Sulfurimonas sp. SWIR-19]|uniref:hypothetical protein n=1 Tax=Sulfurimonas sp. SWIR-19 TaxID=2878390 RepID=UPI001CF1E297|nr:hypothetical protein [Sulfurimonas sp. SWIR-19]UCN01330.1 hypothetical protein LCX93_05275 [Sulfurimonas sp. SWIR-19]
MLKKSKYLLSAALLGLLVNFTPASQLEAAPMKRGSKPFLIQNPNLPHLTMLVKKMWDSKELALTPKQKKELLQVRKQTLSSVMSLKKKIMSLEQKIAKLSQQGVAPQELKSLVDKVASYKAQATMTHLQCIYDTKKILSKEQLRTLLHK